HHGAGSDTPMSTAKRRISLSIGYGIAIMLGLGWICAALLTMRMPLLDLGVAGNGDALISVARLLGLSPDATFALARMIVAAKLAIGTLLLSAPFVALFERGEAAEDRDVMLEIALFLSALATSAALAPALISGGRLLQEAIGELVLCVIAAVL